MSSEGEETRSSRSKEKSEEKSEKGLEVEERD